MSRVFNLLKFYLIRTAAKEKIELEDLPNIRWNDIPGVTDEEKVKYLQTEFASILQNSETPSYDIYSAIGALKYPEVTDPAAHQRFKQVLRALDVLNKEEKARYDAVLALMGNNTDLLMSEAFQQFKLRYVPQISTLMKATRLRNVKPLQDVTELKEFDEEKEALISDLRKTYSKRLVKTFEDQVDSVKKVGLTTEQVAWMLQGTRTSDLKKMPDYQSTAIRIGKESDASLSDADALALGTKVLKDLQKETEANTTTRVGNWQGSDDLMVNLYLTPSEWSDKFKELLSDEATAEMAQISIGKVRKEEILDSLGYSSVQFPQEPKDVFFSPPVPYAGAAIKDLTPEQIEEQNKVKTLRRKNPYNLILLKKIMEMGGFNENGNALDITKIFSTQIEDLPAYGADWNEAKKQISTIRRGWEEFFGQGEGTPPEDMPDIDELFSGIKKDDQSTNWPLHALGYVAKTLCDNNPGQFAEMVTDSGSATIDEIRKQMGKKVIPDTKYSDYNLDFRSQEERNLVERMRSKFGLEVVPYPMGVPKLDGCRAAVSGFQIDFMIASDVISTWKTADDQKLHPLIQEKMVFIGEYFGYDRNTPKPVNVSDDDGFRDIDGEIAKIKRKDGSVVEALNGTELSVGEHYELKTRWKSMTHNVMASLSGNATVLIGKNFKDDNIMDELDKNGIIYQYTSGTQRNNPANLIKSHIPACALPDCQSKSYFNVNPQGGMSFVPKEISKGVAFVRCCLADLDVQEAIKPALLAKDENGELVFGRAKIFAYYQKQRELQNQILTLRRTREYTPEKDAELISELHKVNEGIQALANEVKKYQNTEKYQKTKSELLMLLEKAKTGTMSDSEIYTEATKLIKPWVPFAEKRVASNFSELLYKIAISS